ncbi:MAG: type VI secretion system membrane subunit TssM [Gammaproteobacteria bacterium]|nr:type VI secretion system membrane subunit TssM [Gammaproteobacteria bacterium]
MSQVLTVAQNKKFLLHFSISLILIWIVGPYLAIGGIIPLGTFFHQLAATFVTGIFFFAIEYKRCSKIFTHSSIAPSEINNELEKLHQTLKDVFKHLHRNLIQSFLFRYKKPWYLVLGPTNAGKSTLLHKAELGIKGLDNLPPMMITPTKSFNWWLSEEAVFIDVGGKYLRDTNEPFDIEKLFQGFFKLLKKYRSFKPINGLILMVNLQELTVNTREQTQLQKLRQIIDTLLASFMDFPIYLIITRCDTIEGFTEFFEDLGQDERNQIFGLSFPLTSHTQSLPQLFHDEFNALLTRLNEKIIWRLHRENHPDKIAKIKNFPLQMEFLKNPLAKLLNVILPNTHLNLRGVFFTSTFQKDMPFDNLTKTLERAFDIHHTKNSHRSTPSKGFFINEIFKRIIFPETKFYTLSNKDHRVHLIASLLIVIITATCLGFFYKSYQYNQKVIADTQNAIHALNNLAPQSDLDPLFQKLNLLHIIITQLNNQQAASWYTHVGLQQASKLKKNAEEIYSTLLATQFLSYLQRTLEIQLQNIKDGDTNQLYSALKVYLMLGNHKYLNQKSFKDWFENYWHQLNIDRDTQDKFNQHLQAFFTQPFNNVPLNSQLIERKRALLNNMPTSRLVLTILQNKYQRSPVKLMPELGSNVLNNLPHEVPGIFNILNFKDVYYTQIINTCQEITNGDWVLGKRPQPSFSEIMLNQLSSEVKAIYLNEYAVTWSDILAKVKVEEFQNLGQIVALVDLLNSPESPLIQLMNTIKNNTQPISDSVEFTQQVSTRFLSLNNLSADLLKNTNQGSLVAVKAYLNKIVQAEDLDKASYEAARGRMENPTMDVVTTLLQQSRMLPDPLRTWHTTIAAESWRLILKNTQNYLNRIWIATIYPQYEALLDKRYPLFKDATTDVSLNDFANFFGNGGTMDMFYKNYLQPFVDNSRLYWEWKNIDGQRINIPQATLEMFIRAALIQKMFFPEDSRIPSINFSLVPVELDPSVQSFSLDLEGQTVLFQKDNEQILSLVWPGPTPTHTEISFTNDQGKKTVVTETGAWSWFKILDKSRLEGTNSPKHFRLTFILNSSSVHYELYTNGIVNPFLPGILNAFRCPNIL